MLLYLFVWGLFVCCFSFFFSSVNAHLICRIRYPAPPLDVDLPEPEPVQVPVHVPVPVPVVVPDPIPDVPEPNDEYDADEAEDDEADELAADQREAKFEEGEEAPISKDEFACIVESMVFDSFTSAAERRAPHASVHDHFATIKQHLTPFLRPYSLSSPRLTEQQ